MTEALLHEEPAAQTVPSHVPPVPPVRLRAAMGSAGARTMLVLTAITVIDYALSAILVAAGPDLRRDLGLTQAELQGIASLTLAAFALAGVPAAHVADRGRRPPVIAALRAVAALATGLTAIAHTGWQHALGRTLTGAGQAPAQSAHLALLVDTYPLGARARILALHSAGPAMGHLLGPTVLAATAATVGGWRLGVGVLAVASLLLAVAALRLRDPGTGVADSPRRVAFGQAVSRLLQIRSLAAVLVGASALGLSLVAVPLELSRHLERAFGLDTTERSFALALVELGAVVGLALGARLYERRPDALPLVALTIVSSGVLLCASLQLRSLGACLAGLAAYSLVTAIGTAPLYATVASILPPRLRSLGFSLIGAAIFLGGGVLGSIFAGRLSDDHGPAFAVTAIVLPTVPIAAAVLAFGARFVAGDILRAVPGDTLRAVPGDTLRAVPGDTLDTWAQPSSALVQVRGLTVSYGPVRVLTDVSLDVHEGEVLALLGTNGAGKSTLLRAVSGLTVPDSGTIVVDGIDLTLADPAARVAEGIVQVPGGRAVFADMSVLDNLTAACHTFAWDRNRVRTRIAEVVELLPALADRMDQRAGSLSGGEQQMLALAKALVLQPRVLLIDELSLGLAPVVVGQLIDVVAGLKTSGVTMVIVEQSVNVAVALADRAVFLEKGRVAFTGPTALLLERGDLARAIFLGASRA
jgi:ABC-type branched-subunit amino acid transport system ATPase component/predicted MFS family arabinose efflux permease